MRDSLIEAVGICPLREVEKSDDLHILTFWITDIEFLLPMLISQKRSGSWEAIIKRVRRREKIKNLDQNKLMLYSLYVS